MMDKCVITGCDKKTEWQLPWFVDNYSKHNTIPLLIADFGMSDDMATWARLHCHTIMDTSKLSVKGWMKKPHTMSASPAKNSVWMDTDCEVRGDISPIFDLIKPNKLLMAIDRPWSKRRKETWHNSGVVGYHKTPTVLRHWCKFVKEKPEIRGDQEVLHWMLGNDALRRLTFIEDLPHKYNTLRLDITDGFDASDAVVMHWTGEKGNEEIRRQMKNA